MQSAEDSWECGRLVGSGGIEQEDREGQREKSSTRFAHVRGSPRSEVRNTLEYVINQNANAKVQ